MTNKISEKYRILSQYIKDLSFEVPGAPKYLFKKIEGVKPEIEVSVDIKAKKINEDGFFTLTLSTKVSNKLEKDVIFLVEIDYEAILNLEKMEKEDEEKVLLIDAPALMFPFIRNIICDLTKDSGFPPIVLNQIDFESMYNNKNK